MSSSHATPHIPFSFLLSLTEAFAAIAPRKVGQKSKTAAQESLQTKTLRNWVNALRERHSPLPPGTTAVFFRLFFPEEDVARRYNLQETRLARYVSDIFSIPISPHSRGASLLQWNENDATGCFGKEVGLLLEPSCTNETDERTMAEIDALLTELASTSAFSSSAVRSSATPRRKPKHILRDLFGPCTPSTAALITQIILKDLRPLLYPLSETHFTASLLHYNTNAISMLTKEQAMKVWDPSGHMLNAYRVRALLDEAADAFENPNQTMSLEVGHCIPIPKSTKGQGCSHALDVLKNSSKIWAETKYDGERAQIHVETFEDGASKITIFSKSKRDSTLDRFAVHPIIRDALCLPHPEETHDAPGPSSRGLPRIKQSVILDAEMVAFSDPLNRIDEFWRIRSLISSTAVGVRRKPATTKAAYYSDEDNYSQSSLISDASDEGTRHLALVFFDVLMVDSTSLLHRSYSHRRSILESLINQRPGRAMLSKRTPIHMACRDEARDELTCIFANTIAAHEEGLVLKAEESKYGDWKLPWVKLKRDYIPGYGDCVDLVIVGAGWDKTRARELRVGPTVYTTFYVGAVSTPRDHEGKPCSTPFFEVVFTVSYGLSREDLEELNFLIKSSDPVECNPRKPPPVKGLSYSYHLNVGLSTPAVMLRQPILVELFGAGFTKSQGSKYYELRFPRIAKYYREKDRLWTECSTLAELQQIARQSVGRDRPDKDVDDCVKDMWGIPSSPSVRCPAKRKEREEEWIEKLSKADGRPKPAKVRRLDFSESGGDAENAGASVGASVSAVKKPGGLRRFGSVTNVLASPKSRMAGLQATSLKTSTATKLAPVIKTSVTLPQAPPVPPPATSKSVNQVVCLQEKPSPVDPVCSIPTPASTPPKEPPLADSTMDAILKDAVVWFARSSTSQRPSWRKASHHVVPHGQQVHSLESFLLACGWTAVGSTACSWAERGVVFVDDTKESLQWHDFPMRTLLERRSEIVRGGLPNTKPISVFSMSALAHDLPASEVEKRRICTLG